MSEYYGHPDNELFHYGVKGMRWGVRRATKQLSRATDSASRDKAIASLNKHKTKGTKKIAKLEKQNAKLDKKRYKQITKNEPRAAKIERKAAITRAHAYKRFTSESRAQKDIFKANKMDAQAKRLRSVSEQTKAKMLKNETIAKAMRTEISKIDAAIAAKGKKYITGK